ncbi:MAG: hypothetical protein AAF617_16160, partial [Bacteroidota bacterium]
MSYTEKEILNELDLTFQGIPSENYPIGRKGDIVYSFFLDLEHGYCDTAGSRIHLFADDNNWVMVLEKSGYQDRATRAEIDLCYIGNCIKYHIESYPERNYISNLARVVLISHKEFERIENRNGSDMEQFELINPKIDTIQIRNSEIPIEQD